MSNVKYKYVFFMLILSVFFLLFMFTIKYVYGVRKHTLRINPLRTVLNHSNIIQINKLKVSALRNKLSKLDISETTDVEIHIGRTVQLKRVDEINTEDKRVDQHLDGDTSDCKEREVKLSTSSLPLTGLVSFPGSGNTWLRHLIQQMTGIATSSVYCDKKLRNGGFPFECVEEKDRAIVVKTHLVRDIPAFKKIVLLLRNPYDAFLSYAHWDKAGHTKHPPLSKLKRATDRLYKKSVASYVYLIRIITGTFKGPVHIVQYDRLKTDLSQELKQLANFLNVHVSDSDIDCTVKLQEGNFHRDTDEKRHIDLLHELYNMKKLTKMRRVARKSEKLIKQAYNIDVDLGGRTEKILFQDNNLLYNNRSL